MTFAEYQAAPGLSNSMLKDLAVSPLRMWHRWIRKDRELQESTSFQEFGQALHCAVLESSEFENRYSCRIDASDFEGCLITMEDLRGWIRDKGFRPQGTRKAEVIAQVQSIDPEWPILDVLEDRHHVASAGKVIFHKEDWWRLGAAAQALREEPKFMELLAEGEAEVPMFTRDKETAVMLKGRLDWVAPKVTVDIKSFSQKHGKSIDQSVADALYYEGYIQQGYFYSLLRGWPHDWAGEHVIAFVESEPPHEVRIKALRAKRGGQANLYWQKSMLDVRGLIRLYADCMDHFGDKPWKLPSDVNALEDEDIRQLAYA